MKLRELHDYGRTVSDKRRFGIEIEVEGENLPHRNFDGWNVTGDPSVNGLEYVFDQPVDLKEARRLVKVFNSKMEEFDAKPEFSIRTGVHVHVNVQHRTPAEVFNMVYLYWLFEDLLVNYCGPNRVGNLFCLRRVDAEAQEDMIHKAIQFNNLRLLGDHNYKYAALNLSCLFNLGTLEFRALRGTSSPFVLGKWLTLINRLYDAAVKLENPAEIERLCREQGIDVLCETVLGDAFKWIKPKYRYQDMIDETFSSIAYIFYGGDWSKENTWGYRREDQRVFVNKRPDALFDDQFADAPEPAPAQPEVGIGIAPQPHDKIVRGREILRRYYRDNDLEDGRFNNEHRPIGQHVMLSPNHGWAKNRLNPIYTIGVVTDIGPELLHVSWSSGGSNTYRVEGHDLIPIPDYVRRQVLDFDVQAEVIQ